MREYFVSEKDNISNIVPISFHLPSDARQKVLTRIRDRFDSVTRFILSEWEEDKPPRLLGGGVTSTMRIHDGFESRAKSVLSKMTENRRQTVLMFAMLVQNQHILRYLIRGYYAGSGPNTSGISTMIDVLDILDNDYYYNTDEYDGES